MKHCKKIISSILMLTLFAGSVVNLSSFATGSNSDKPNTEQSQQEKSNAFNRCRNYADELDKIKNSVNEISNLSNFNKAFERLNSLKSKLSENDKIVLAEHINATESYLKEMKEKAFQHFYNLYYKRSSENYKLASALEEKQNELKSTNASSFWKGTIFGEFLVFIVIIH